MDVDLAEAGTLKHSLPRRHMSLAPPSAAKTDPRTLPILEGAVEWNRPHELILTTPEALERGRVVRGLDVESLEEGAAFVCSPSEPSDPEASTTSQPDSTRARRDTGQLAPNRRAGRTSGPFPVVCVARSVAVPPASSAQLCRDR